MTFPIIALVAIFILAVALLWREGLIKKDAESVFIIIFAALALVIRAFMFDFESGDYKTFLEPWVDYLRANGGFAAIASYPGNYNPPYIYFLAAISYLGVRDLYMIKLFSVLFDVLLAYACMKLLSCVTSSRTRLLTAFFVVLYLPTVVINGAYWGQCDSVYAFFGIWALYLAMRGKGKRSMASLAVCFGFKLQAVFIIPAFFPLLLAKKIKWRDLLVFPLVYIILMLPNMIAGGGFIETLTLYFRQAGTVGDAMNYNAPSLTSMFSWSGDTSGAAKLFIAAAFLFVLIVFAYSYLRRNELSNRVLIGLAVVLCMGIPFLLPHMHDRYFYIAGVLSIVLAASDECFFPAPVFAEMASLHCYYAYFAGYYLYQPRINGILMLLSLLFCIAFTAAYERKERKIEKFKIDP